MSFLKRSLIESWKFGVYLMIPIFTVYVIAQPHNMKTLLEYKQYVVYPPEGPRPPTGSKEEIKRKTREILDEQKAKRAASASQEEQLN